MELAGHRFGRGRQRRADVARIRATGVAESNRQARGVLSVIDSANELERRDQKPPKSSMR